MSYLRDLLSAVVLRAGALVAQRRAINFSNSFTVTDDPANDRVNVSLLAETEGAPAPRLMDVLIEQNTTGGRSIDFQSGDHLIANGPLYVDDNRTWPLRVPLTYAHSTGAITAAGVVGPSELLTIPVTIGTITKLRASIVGIGSTSLQTYVRDMELWLERLPSGIMTEITPNNVGTPATQAEFDTFSATANRGTAAALWASDYTLGVADVTFRISPNNPGEEVRWRAWVFVTEIPFA